MKKATTRFILALVVLSSSVVSAQSSKDYAMMARQAWAAFECSSLASVAEVSKEQERLFKFGYERGKGFIEALYAKKIVPADISSVVPIGFLWVIEGPSADFVLGRVFESAQKDALNEVFVTKGTTNPKDLQRAIAQRRFDERNCRLIGSGQ